VVSSHVFTTIRLTGLYIADRESMFKLRILACLYARPDNKFQHKSRIYHGNIVF